MNTYGDKFRVTTYGESHGPAVGAVIDGCPAGVRLDMDFISRQLERRRTGAPRSEADQVEWLSGLLDGITLGSPLAFAIRNVDARPEDYAQLEHLFRPGHADYTCYQKYGIRDHRGGGRSSARETVARVVAGAVAQQLMPEVIISSEVRGRSSEVRGRSSEVRGRSSEVRGRSSEVRGRSSEAADASNNSELTDTVGGVVRCRVDGVSAGVGEPIFGKLNAALAAAMMSIPSAIGFEMGAGFAAAQMKGSEYIDRWNADGSTKTNNCGGIQGGISNGMPVEFSVAFHPVVTIPQPVECLSEENRLETVNLGGRHDRYHIERAAVVVEAMTALCLINYML